MYMLLYLRHPGLLLKPGTGRDGTRLAKILDINPGHIITVVHEQSCA